MACSLRRQRQLSKSQMKDCNIQCSAGQIECPRLQNIPPALNLPPMGERFPASRLAGGNPSAASDAKRTRAMYSGPTPHLQAIRWKNAPVDSEDDNNVAKHLIIS